MALTRAILLICALYFVMSCLLRAELLSHNPSVTVLQKEISIDSSGLRKKDNAPFTGEVVSYYANGQLASLDSFRDGRRDGASKRWFDDGTLAYQSSYASGVRQGITQSWWFNGNLRSETNFVNGKAEGESWSWYRNGNKFKKYQYAKGKQVGLQQAWRLNGDLFANYEYKNGRVFGLKKSNTCVGLEDDKISFDYYRKQSVIVEFSELGAN